MEESCDGNSLQCKDLREARLETGFNWYLCFENWIEQSEIVQLESRHSVDVYNDVYNPLLSFCGVS